MKLKHVFIVFRKEVKDLLRDKRTIITSIMIPMLIIPLINIIMGGSVEKFTKDINENVTISLSQASDTDEIRQLVRDRLIRDNPNLRLVDADNPDEALASEEIRCILDFEDGFDAKMKIGKPFKITLLYDESKTKSQASLGIIIGAIERFKAEIISERIAALGLDMDILRPIVIEQSNVAQEGTGGNMMLMMVLPMLLGMLVSVGGIAAATDLVAGEKERNTFEPLLTTLPDRASLLLGKYLAVTIFSFASVTAIALGLTGGYLINPNSLTMGVDPQLQGFTIQLPALLLLIIITIALGMTFSGIQIAISTFARSYKEAQTYMSFLMIGAMLPGYATMFMQPGEIKFFMFLLPVLNTISSFKMVLGSVTNYANLLLALVSSAVFVIVTLWFASSLFNKEKVLFRN